MGALDKLEGALKDAVTGAGRAVGELGKGVERAAQDTFHGVADGLKTEANSAAAAGKSVIDGVRRGAHDLAEGAQQGHILAGAARAEQDLAAGAGHGLSQAWNGTTTAAAKLGLGAAKTARDVGGAVGNAFDRGAEGMARSVTDVAGQRAGDAVRATAHAVAEPVRQEAGFAFGVAEGVADGAGAMVKGTGDIVVGGVRMGTDAQYRDKLIAKAKQTIGTLGHVAEAALHDPAAAARAVERGVKGAAAKLEQGGEAAARQGKLGEWFGHGVGEVGFQAASMVLAPEAKAGEAADVVEHAAAWAGDAGRLSEAAGRTGEAAEAAGLTARATAGTEAERLDAVMAGSAERTGGKAAEVADATEMGGVAKAGTARLRPPVTPASTPADKIDFALVDSGTGGGMPGALLDGEVRQLGHYFCLPLGEKPAEQATAYTAAMILQPMIRPLRNTAGSYDGKVAQNVIIACNTASVRVDDAVPLIGRYCQAAVRDPKRFGLDDLAMKNVREIAESVKADRIAGREEYATLHGRIHEIAQPTVDAGANKAVDALIGPGAHQDRYFMRVDSTNGTAKNSLYPTQIRMSLLDPMKQAGFDLVDEAKSDPRSFTVDNESYAISHLKLTFRNAATGAQKEVLVEGRGNPPWVPAIEGKNLDTLTTGLNGERNMSLGNVLVQKSNRASELARAEAAKAGFGDVSGFEATPDLQTLACTHYPAMQDYMMKASPAADAAGGASEFLNQATVVRDIRNRLPGAEDREIQDFLAVVQTRGSRAVGGDQSLKAAGVDQGIGQSEGILAKVIGQTRQNAGINTPFGVKVYLPDKVEEDKFEDLNRAMGLLSSKKIMSEQLFRADAVPGGAESRLGLESPRPTLSRRGLAEKERNWGREQGIVRQPLDAPVLSRDVAQRVDRLAQTVTRGRDGPAEFLATQIDGGRHLQDTARQLGSVVRANQAAEAGGAKQTVGILAGFKDRDAAGSLIDGLDGPPGAAAMARTLTDQGTPVKLITDTASERVTLESLVGAKLAERTGGGGTLADYKLKTGITLEVAAVPDTKAIEAGVDEARLGMTEAQKDVTSRQDMIAQAVGAHRAHEVDRIKDALKQDNTTTLISSKRPGPNQTGVLTDDRGGDVGPFNADLSGLMKKDANWSPYTIAIASGGNEIGMGRLSDQVRTFRAPNLERIVPHGDKIAGDLGGATDALILSSAANNGALAVSMATRAALGLPAVGENGLAESVETYGGILQHLAGSGPIPSIAGRPLGVASAEVQHRPGERAATHQDMLRDMTRAMDTRTP